MSNTVSEDLGSIEEDLAQSFEQYRLAEGAYLTATPAASRFAAQHFIRRIEAYFASKLRQVETEAKKAVLEDISQRINYDDYSGLEPSKAWKKLYYHVEGSLDAMKRLTQEKGKSDE